MKKILNKINKFSLSFLTFVFLFISLTSTTNAGITDANSDYTDLSSHEGNAQGFQFNNDGTKFFVVGKTGDLTEFSMSTAYDVSTASHEGEIDIPGQGTGMTGLAFNGDGTVMFVVNESTDKVHPFTLNTAWNPIGGIASTGTAVSVSSGDNCPTDLQFNNDGSKLYIIGCEGDRVDEYDLTSNYTLNATMSVARTSVNVSDRNPRAVIFSPDGTIMITNGIQDGCLPHQFTLSTPFDVSSAASNGELTVSPDGCRSMSFNDDGTKIYFIKRTGTIFEYDVSPAYKIRDSAPALGSSVPADNATNVATDANIVLNFNEDVDVKTGNITIKKTSDDSTVATIDVTSGQVSGSGTSQITINPTSDLPAGEELYVLIDVSAFDNAGGLSYAGISSTTALSFTTESMVDPTTDKDVVGSIDVQSQLAKNSISQSTSTVSSRLSYLRQNRGNDNLSKNNIKLDFGNAILTSLTNELLAKNDKSIIPDNWSSWSEGSLSSSKIGDSLGSSSSETDAQALAFGFDTKLNDSDLLGFAVQYGQSDTDVGSSGTNVESENINLSVYRTRPLDNDNFIEGLFGVGLIESDLKRISGANTLTGSRSGTQIFGSINYGKTLDKGDFNLTPIARVDLGYTELDAYKETGTDALSYAKQTIESGLASVGLELSDIVKFNDNKLKPFGSIEYGMDFSNSSNAKMNYVSDTSTIYTYTQGANSNHLITSVVGFEYITKDNLEIISSYKRIQGNESEQTDILNVSVNFKSKRETEYAMSVDGSEDLKAAFDITKNVNGFNLKFNANRSLSENSDQAANVSLSRSF